MNELNSKEKEILKNMEDHRCVSHALESAFCTGELKAFRDYIQAHNSEIDNKKDKLAVLLRGNNDSLIVYKDNHKIWELSRSKKGYRVSFNFDHARYCKEWKEELEKLTDLGFKVKKNSKADVLKKDERIQITRNKNKEVTGGKIGIISCERKSFDGEFVKKSFDIIQELVKIFFECNDTDYFREAVAEEYSVVRNKTGAGGNVLVEKRWQQRLLFHFDDMQNGYYAYDLEFSQKYPDTKYVKRFAEMRGEEYETVNHKTIKEKLGTNEPDMLMLKYANEEPKALVLLEVKSTYSACKGNAGVEEHMKGMAKYAEQEVFMQNRRKDAYLSLCQYQKMGMIDNTIILREIPNNLPVKKVILFTNANIEEDKTTIKKSALDYLEEKKDDICKWANDYKCEVWTADNNYWDENICIEERYIPGE